MMHVLNNTCYNDTVDSETEVKIKYEKLKRREEKLNKSKLYRILKKIFKTDEKESDRVSLKEQIFSMIYFEIIGAILCLLVLFAMTGGQNYFKICLCLSHESP